MRLAPTHRWPHRWPPAASAIGALLASSSRLLAQSGEPAATQSTPSSPGPVGLMSTVWDLTLKGGPVMVPIAICSLVALALVVERLWSLQRAKVMPPAFVAGVRPALSRGQGAALDFCRSHPSPISRVLEAGIRRWDRPLEQVEKHITEAGLRETTLLRTNFRGLVVITAVSPLLGLLGTIFGMITAFRTVAASGDALGRTELLAGGIYEAMVTTAAGLDRRDPDAAHLSRPGRQGRSTGLRHGRGVHRSHRGARRKRRPPGRAVASRDDGPRGGSHPSHRGRDAERHRSRHRSQRDRERRRRPAHGHAREHTRRRHGRGVEHALGGATTRRPVPLHRGGPRGPRHIPRLFTHTHDDLREGLR
jgi:biopolymer transport protein ExbB